MMIYVLFILVVIFSSLIFWIIKKTKKPNYDAIHIEREKANAPKILYLRAFNNDGDDYSNGNISILHLLPKEMELADALIRSKYHLVAVGRPDEDLPEIGFHRKKFDHLEWQEEVLKLMEESVLVIWRPDITQGVLWELNQLLKLNYRHKLIVWAEMGYGNLEDLQKDRYNVFKRTAFEQFSEVFPEYNKYKKFLVSEAMNQWIALNFLYQIPIINKILSEK